MGYTDTLIEWLFKNRRPTTVLEQFWHFNKPLNTPAFIIKREKLINNVEYYYIKLCKEDYRRFVESIYLGGRYVSIGFERFNKRWSSDNLTDELPVLGILVLFSTLKTILIEIEPRGVYLSSNIEPHKIIRYYFMLMKMKLENYTCVRLCDGSVILYKDKKASKLLHEGVIRFKYRINRYK